LVYEILNVDLTAECGDEVSHLRVHIKGTMNILGDIRNGRVEGLVWLGE
jgi:hypothetical protein